jgi:predicted nuclease with TOPRIM domain
MANTKITRSSDGGNEEFFNRLIHTLDTSMKNHADHLVTEQAEISEKFDDLQKTYAELIERLTTIEAKDFGSAVHKIDSSLKKMISLEHQTGDLADKMKDANRIIEELKDKCHRANLIINIALGVLLSVVVPLLIGILPYIIELIKKGQPQ